MNKQEQTERIKKIILERGIDTAAEWIALELEGVKEVLKERGGEITALRDALNTIREINNTLPAFMTLKFELASTVLDEKMGNPVVEHVAKGTIIKFSSYMIISFTAENGDPFRYSIALDGNDVSIANLYRDGDERKERVLSRAKAKTEIKTVSGEGENA